MLQYAAFADHEIGVLLKADMHHHVVRYFDTEKDDDFVYLALEECEGNLEDLVTMIFAQESQAKDQAREKLQRVYQNVTDVSQEKLLQLMHETAQGIEYLHSLNIVHGDMKPHNVLISKMGLAKVSDMGLCRELRENQNSIVTDSNGTAGW